jgi:tetratricopeptide (TPR) repeat protein
MGPRPYVQTGLPPLTDLTSWNELTGFRRKYASVDLGSSRGSGIARIHAQLDKKMDLEFVDTSLKEVIEEIMRRNKIPIIIDTTSLEDFGIGTETPISIRLRQVSLKSTLDLILGPLDLSYVIRNDAVQIIATKQMHRLLAGSFWSDETLLMIPRRVSSFEPTGPAETDQETSLPLPLLDDPGIVNRLAKGLSGRMDQRIQQRNLLYPAVIGPSHSNHSRHLLNFARGITTTRSDALAVLEKEAGYDERPKTGQVDKEARVLIDAARRQGWQRVARRDATGQDHWQMDVDGQGRFRYERKTAYGLTETVVCNGESLWHLYPELGLGTTRTQSRFHRAELTSLVPWLVPPAEDLAIGADVRLVGQRTIAIAPHGLADIRDDEGEPRVYHRLHLVFSPAGRLSARHLVEMPAGKTVARVTYDADGTTRWFKADNTLGGESTFSIEAIAAPNLGPNVTDLVMLPMPIRTRAHVYATVRNRAASLAASSDNDDALQTIVADQNGRQLSDPVNWNEEDALRLLVALQGQHAAELRKVIGRRFFAKGDRRLGFYTLLSAHGQKWETEKPVQLGDGTATRMSPLADHPDSPLARYLESVLRETPLESVADEDRNGEAKNNFISQFTEFKRLCLLWHPFRPLPEDAETRHQQLERVFDFIESCDSSRFAFVLLRRVQRQYGTKQPHHRIAEALIKLESQGATSFVIKYELARSLSSHGRRKEAQQLFMELYRDSIDAGIVPPIDQSFVTALKNRDRRVWANEDSGKDFAGFMRGACAHLVEHDQRGAAISLAWQCRQLGKGDLAKKLIDLVLTGIPEHRRLETSLMALAYLVQTDDHERALSLLQPLLAMKPYSESSELWRLAARLAKSNGMLARSINGLERAADLDYANLSESYNVELVRQTYSQLVARYQEMAKIVAQDSPDASLLELATRVVQAVDRWRSLDTDPTAACQQAAKLLNTLGHDELAWDYLTTPLATKPNESTAWLNLAQSLRNQDSVDLANRAYDAAWEAEPTNARILWDHAQMLEHAGRLEDARHRYQKLVDGEWQPRFRPLKGRAQRIMAAAAN